LFIDEIDSHLHILLLENLIKFIHQSNLNSTAQFFFNIHNLDLLDLELFRKDQIWFAEKDNF
jgi:AAA15 family ATPase/GTPase